MKEGIEYINPVDDSAHLINNRLNETNTDWLFSTLASKVGREVTGEPKNSNLFFIKILMEYGINKLSK